MTITWETDMIGEWDHLPMIKPPENVTETKENPDTRMVAGMIREGESKDRITLRGEKQSEVLIFEGDRVSIER